MPRKFISPEVLFDDIRIAILNGLIPSNETNKPCYVLPDVTYLASPRGFQCLFDKRIYNRDPKSEVNIYLDALAKIPAAHKHPKGTRMMVLRRVSVRPGANPLWVVAFDTRGLFRSEAEIAEVGFWTKTPIRELSDEEIRASQGPAIRVPPVGVAHA